MISLDTETTGVDLRHGARPFFVTVCREEGTEDDWWEYADNLIYWEWEVDPLTREVDIPEGDIETIRHVIGSASRIVGQNLKFDCAALAVAGIMRQWPWHKSDDTLLASHLLSSNTYHDLTSLGVQYVGRNIQAYEDDLKKACNEARRLARSKLKDWLIAAEGLEGMPSAKSGSKVDKKGTESESPWKFDCWLPKAVATELRYPDNHPWHTVLAEYANADSDITLAVWKIMEAELKSRDLWEMYQLKLRNNYIIANMERRGVTYSVPELRSMQREYVEESKEAERQCVSIAAKKGHELTLPKSGNNKSLTQFIFNVMNMPIEKTTDKGNPSFDKDVIEAWLLTLEKGSDIHSFLKNLKAKRKRDKSLEFLASYEKFGLKLPGEAGVGYRVLHPSINPTATATTRLSCSHPNLQQVSKQETDCEECKGEGCELCGHTGEDLQSVRKVFGPAPGREWWTADASNIELRIPAYESEEEDLIELFERPNDPPFYGSNHLLNFSIVFDDVWQAELKKVGFERVGPHCKEKYKATYYQYTKNGDFALQYQAGQKTADKAFHRPGFVKLKQKFVRLDDLNRWCVSFANKHGYIETLVDRDINLNRGYPLLCARGERGGIKPTTPLNYRVQGTAGVWMVKAMNRCQEQLDKWREESNFDAFMALMIHDELIFDFPKYGDPVAEAKRKKAATNGKPVFRTSNLWRAKTLQRIMERCGEGISIPTPVNLEYHPVNWREGISL